MNNPRRRFVTAFAGGVVAIPLSAVLQTVHAADMPRVSPDDATAKALNYAHQSADPNKLCSGCQFYSDANAVEWGPCVIFPGQLVNANGVCNSWFKRAG